MTEEAPIYEKVVAAWVFWKTAQLAIYSPQEKYHQALKIAHEAELEFSRLVGEMMAKKVRRLPLSKRGIRR
jgi:hypothetical protein